MKVLIAAASSSPELSGVPRHGFNVARCLLARPEVTGVELVVAPWQRELVTKSGLEPSARLRVHLAEMTASTLSRNLWYYRELPALAARLDVDLVHLSYPVPVRAGAFSCPTVVTLHDMYPYQIPSNFGLLKGLFNRLVLRQCLLQVDSIACVSDVTRRNMESYMPARLWSRAVRIYNCVEPEVGSPLRSPLEAGDEGPFLLCVAQHRRNKNLLFLVGVLERLIRSGAVHRSTRLIVVGIAGPETGRIQRAIGLRGLGKNVLLMQGLPEPELQWSYRKCSVLLCASTIEGFGLPIVEGLMAGCRIVCSDIAAFREAGLQHCRYVKLKGHAEEGFAAAVVAALREPRRQEIKMPWLSVPVIGEQYVRLYSNLLASAAEARVRRLPVAHGTAAPERQSQ